uniref:DUF659 domain-containing protein n=1 Tax=Strongyloides papillosus TaxID=174720 RepID=A0A0N5BG97_STREA
MRILDNKYFKIITKSPYHISRSSFTRSLEDHATKLRQYLASLIPKSWCLTLDGWSKGDLKIYAYVASFLSPTGPQQYLLDVFHVKKSRTMDIKKTIDYLVTALQSCLDDLESEILEDPKQSESSDTGSDDNDCSETDFTSNIVSQEDELSLSSSDNESGNEGGKGGYKRKKKYGFISVDKSSIESLKNNAKKMFVGEINLIKLSNFYKKAAYLDPRTTYTQLYTMETWCEIEKEISAEFVEISDAKKNDKQKNDEKTLFGPKKLNINKILKMRSF